MEIFIVMILISLGLSLLGILVYSIYSGYNKNKNNQVVIDSYLVDKSVARLLYYTSNKLNDGNSMDNEDIPDYHKELFSYYKDMREFEGKPLSRIKLK